MAQPNAPRKYKWGGRPFGVDQETADGAYGVLESSFTKAWLEGRQEHRLQKVWGRDDFLAGYELFLFGRALQRVKDLDAKKAQELVRAIRKGGTTAHGLLYEVQALAMLAEGGHHVAGTPKNEPGYDALVRFDNGMTMRWSFKNHDQSDRERVFRERCQKLYEHLHAYAGVGALERLLVLADRHLGPEDFGAITLALKALPVGRIMNVLPQVDVLLSKVVAPEGEQPFALDARSTQLTIVATHHAIEQSNFTSKLAKAAANMQKHCPRKEKFSNVVLMRVHPTADVAQLQAVATEMLNRDGCVVDAVVLHQPSVTRENSNWSLVSHVQMALGPHYPLNCPLKMVLPAGMVSTSPSPTILRSDDQHIGLTGKYLFQRGLHVREAQRREDGSLWGELTAPADGIQEQSIFSMGGRRLRFGGRHPVSDELFLI
ncbi:hypothetical protein N8A90_13285 [Variovorax sp. N23]|nr:hypothetical protein [Variovorax sp. N23]